MNQRDIESIVLDLTVEDSYSLPEIVDRVAGIRVDLDRTSIQVSLRFLIAQMHDAGLLLMTRLASPEAPEQLLDSASSRAALANDLEWVTAQEWKPHARVAATPLGRGRYLGEQ